LTEEAISLLAFLVGIVLSFLIVITYSLIYRIESRRSVVRTRKEFEKSKNKPDSKELVDGYRQRESSLLILGTILIPTSFVLLGLANQTTPGLPRAAIALASPLLYLTWLFFSQLPVRVMTDMETEAVVLTGNPTAVFKRELYGGGEGKTSLMRIRRNHWLVYVFLLVPPALIIAFG